MPTPPPSPLISLSPPSAGERLAKCTAPSAHSSPPPIPSPLLPSSGCPTQTQTLRIASTQALIDAITAALPSPPLPQLPPSVYIPPPVDHRDDIPECKLPPRKRSCLFSLGLRYEVGESSTARPTRGREIDYRFISTLDAEARRQGIREETILIMEEEAYASREAWAHSIGLSQTIHHELQTHHEQMQQTKMVELRETDRRRKAQMVETLRVIKDMRREMVDMQAELLALREQQRRAGEPGPDARVPGYQEASRDVDSRI
ncbi:hypothetical protein Tco_1489370 [Tanacetum coccineum]